MKCFDAVLFISLTMNTIMNKNEYKNAYKKLKMNTKNEKRILKMNTKLMIVKNSQIYSKIHHCLNITKSTFLTV